MPSIARLHTKFGRALKRHYNTNVYLTGGGLREGITPHNDAQCTLIVQTHGAKRWRLWLSPQLFLPVNSELIYGKEGGKTLDAARLGEPYATVVVRAGDVAVGDSVKFGPG